MRPFGAPCRCRADPSEPLPLFTAPHPQPANVLLVREQGSNRLVAKVRFIGVDLKHS